MSCPNSWVIAWSAVGAAFYTAGTVGLQRMPDLRCRLHALAKADTLGLGCVVVAPLAETFAGGIKVVLAWVFALIAAATAARALATPAPRHEDDVEPAAERQAGT